MVLDVHPRVRPMLVDPGVPLLLTEGSKKVDAAVSNGMCALGVIGVWTWRGRNDAGGKAALPDWESVALNGRKVYLCFDSDVMEKVSVYRALARLREMLISRGANVHVIYLPSGPTGAKIGLDDWLAADHSRTRDHLLALAEHELRKPPRGLSEHSTVLETLEDAPASDDLVIPHGYKVGSGGIAKVDERWGQDGVEQTRVLVASAPVYLAGRLHDEEAGEESLVLHHLRAGQWRRETVDRGTAMDARSLVRLAGRGLPVTSGRSGLLVEYLDACESANLDRLPSARVSAVLGWQGDAGRLGVLIGKRLVRAGEEDLETDVEATDPRDWGEGWVSFRGADAGDEQIAAAFRPGGTCEGWLSAVDPIAAYPRVLLAFYASLAAPLLPVLGAANFGVDLAYATSRGKTTALRIAGSIWGVPDERQPESVVGSWDATRVWIERASATLNGLPLILDESKRARHPRVVGQVLYDVANGRGRGRGTPRGMARSGSWATVLLTTGEQRATSFTQDGGTRARILTLWGPPFGAADASTAKVVNGLNAGVKEHHGHAGPRWARYLAEHRDEWGAWRALHRARREAYAERAAGDPVLGRIAEYCATVDVAARLAHEALDLPWPYADPIRPLWADLAAEAGDADRAREALDLTVSWAHSHEHEFHGRHREDRDGAPISSHAGWAGRWGPGEDWRFVAFYPDRLRGLLAGWGHEPDSTLDLWRGRGWMEVGGDRKRREKKVRMRGGKKSGEWMLVIRREAVDAGAGDE